MARKTMWKNLTLREKMIIYLKAACKAKIVDTRGSRTALKGEFRERELYFFLGNNGAVRINDKNAFTGSRSKTDFFLDLMKQQESLLEIAYNNDAVTLG